MKIDFKKVLAEKRALVWPEIEKYLSLLSDFPDYCQISKNYQSLSSFHQSIVSDYPKRQGKYLRPTLTLLTAQAMGFSEKKAIKTAAAMQMSEDWILNHDDIEDDSLQRRGKPALHQMIGKELAINAGDGLQTLMWKLVCDNGLVLGEKKAKKITDEFFWMISRTILGQTVELKWMKDNKKDLSVEDVFFILESKTAYYTISGPMRLGAILAGATEDQLEAIYQFGRPLGRCFQIVDDLLDLTSDFGGLKSKAGNDIYEGKRTVMLVHLLANAKGSDKKKLERIIAKSRQKKAAREVSWVIETMGKYSSIDYGRKLAEKFKRQAREVFEKKLDFLSCQPARNQLIAGMEFILERDH